MNIFKWFRNKQFSHDKRYEDPHKEKVRLQIQLENMTYRYIGKFDSIEDLPMQSKIGDCCYVGNEVYVFYGNGFELDKLSGFHIHTNLMSVNDLPETTRPGNAYLINGVLHIFLDSWSAETISPDMIASFLNGKEELTRLRDNYLMG